MSDLTDDELELIEAAVRNYEALGDDALRMVAEIRRLRAERADVRTILERSWRVTKGAPLWEHAARVIEALRFDHEEKCGVVFANLRAARIEQSEVRSELGLDLAHGRQATHAEVLAEIRRLQILARRCELLEMNR